MMLHQSSHLTHSISFYSTRAGHYAIHVCQCHVIVDSRTVGVVSRWTMWWLINKEFLSDSWLWPWLYSLNCDMCSTKCWNSSIRKVRLQVESSVECHKYFAVFRHVPGHKIICFGSGLVIYLLRKFYGFFTSGEHTGLAISFFYDWKIESNENRIKYWVNVQPVWSGNGMSTTTTLSLFHSITASSLAYLICNSSFLLAVYKPVLTCDRLPCPSVRHKHWPLLQYQCTMICTLWYSNQ
jgi:hypothetical protein